MTEKVKITLQTLDFADIKPAKKAVSIKPVPKITIEPTPTPPDEVMASYSGKVFNALAKVNTKDAQEVKNKLVMRQAEAIFIISKTINNIPVVLGINAHKLLKYGLDAFIKQNPNLRKEGNTFIQYEVAIPFEPFCRDIGYKIDPDPNAPNPAAEKKRTQERLRDARRNIRQLLDRLHDLSSTWTEKTRHGKTLARANEAETDDLDFTNYSFVGTHSIKDGLIKMTLDPTFINDYIVALALPQTKYNRRLAGIKDSIAYILGDMLYQHYVFPNNVIKGTNDILKVETILKGLPLPTYEELEGVIDPKTGKRVGGKDPRRWRDRIKERLEEALDLLYADGTLGFWSYTKAKKQPYTDQEAQEDLYYYERWKESYVHFAFTGNHTVSLIEEYKKEAEGRASKRKKATVNTKST